MIDELVAQLQRDAATEQELGDDYGDMSGEMAEHRAQWHWGKADALRDVLADIKHMKERDA